MVRNHLLIWHYLGLVNMPMYFACRFRLATEATSHSTAKWLLGFGYPPVYYGSSGSKQRWGKLHLLATRAGHGNDVFKTCG